MNNTRRLAADRIGSVLCTALLGVLTGCIGYGDRPPPQARAYAPPPPVYVESAVVVQDNYVYYPGYQVYYGGNTRQYVYLEGRSWVSRPAPPHVSVDVLFASPSVRLDFHDSPAIHHAAVVRQYPQHWAPPGSGHGNQEGHDEGNQRRHD
jgi:hypothetical protein